jgi:hypothetical protein
VPGANCTATEESGDSHRTRSGLFAPIPFDGGLGMFLEVLVNVCPEPGGADGSAAATRAARSF